MPGCLHIDHDAGVTTLTLNRPSRLNALDLGLRHALADALQEAAGDSETQVLVITGAGERAFCAGQDLAESGDVGEARSRAWIGSWDRMFQAFLELPKPVIAALNGPAAGGGANLALACDLRIASERASIGQTFNRIGLHPDWGGTFTVPRLVGPARAAELFFLAEMIPAAEAERIGLVNRVVPHEDLMETARGWAERLAAKPPLPLLLAKRAIQASLSSTVEEMLEYELDAQRRCFHSADALEGVRAFLEKREPRFTGSDDSQTTR